MRGGAAPTILIVDDNSDVRAAMMDCLAGYGMATLEATNGIQALRMLEKGLIPDAIVLDLGLPFMSGWSFLNQLRSDPTFCRLAVVILTAHDVTSAQIPQADAVLMKPVRPQDLIDALDDSIDAHN